MLFNYHTHTKRCNHAVGEDREYVEKAIERGIKTLGFSDHAPYLFPNTEYYSHFRMKQEELHEYAEAVRALAKEYKDDIRILCGFELEYYPDFHAEEMKFLSAVKPDYLILGQHFIGNELNGYYAYDKKGKTLSETFLTAYVTQALAGLATGDFLYLAHPDLPGCNFLPEIRQREYRRLCEGAKRMNFPLEINYLGIRTKRHYPAREFFEIAANVGNDIILGVDAHIPNALIDPDSEKVALDMVNELCLKLIEKPLL